MGPDEASQRRRRECEDGREWRRQTGRTADINDNNEDIKQNNTQLLTYRLFKTMSSGATATSSILAICLTTRGSMMIHHRDVHLSLFATILHPVCVFAAAAAP
jgi:hypothetical protein